MNQQALSRERYSVSDAKNAFMVVSIDQVNIVVPGQDVSTFESVHDLETSDLSHNSIGWVRYSGNRIPVYCFTDTFDMSDYLLENRSICVVLNDSDIAFMCSEIRALEYTVDQILPLPDCMANSATPVEAFCLYKRDNETRTAMLCGARSIRKFIERSGK